MGGDMAGGMRGGFNPRQMQKQMRSMGISQTPVDDAVEVIIRCKSKDIVISSPSVTIVTMQGTKTFQILGEVSERAPGSEVSGPVFADEDIEIVMSQTGCDRDTALKALEETDGQPAEAIIKIISG